MLNVDTQAPKLYSFIWQYLSVGSVEEIKQHKAYVTFSVDKDPVALWAAIVETHRVDGVSKVPAIMKKDARKVYNDCKQGGFESLVTYRERFDAAHKSLEDAGNTVVSPADQAMDFFEGLDPNRYSDFRATINNQMELNSTITLPTVNRVYELASKWVKAVPVHGRQGNATTYVTTTLDQIPVRATHDEKPEPEVTPKSAEVLATTESIKTGDGKSKVKVKCFKCGIVGHYANKCPEKEEEATGDVDQDDQIHTLNATWEAATFCTYHQVNNAVDENLKVGPNEVLLDNCADISVIRPHLLEGIKDGENNIKINGVGGLTLTVNKTGYLPEFFEVYASEETLANVLSFSEVEDLYPISYVAQEAFIVHLPNRNIEFKRRGKLYVAQWDNVAAMMATVQETEALYTKAEVKRAKEAHAFIKNSGYPSLDELVKLVENGNILDMPSISRADIKRAYELYGMPVEYTRGKLTKQQASRVRYEPALRDNTKDQVLYTDVMHIDSNKFLISVCEPLQLTLQTPVANESADTLGTALQSHLQILREKSFSVKCVHVDPASAFQALRTQYPGTEIDVGGARDFVAKVDAKIRRIKDTYRCVKAGLPWQLAISRVKDLVAYCVSRLNLMSTTALNGVLSPRVLFTGIKPNYKRELSLAFGDYVEVHNGTTNTSKERSIPCIALYPLGNSTGSWLFWSISTRSYVRRSTWVKMVTTQLVTTAMDSDAIQEEATLPQPETLAEAIQEGVVESPVADKNNDDDPEDDEYADMPDLGDGDRDDDSDDEVEVPTDGPRRSARVAAGVKPRERLTLATKVASSKNEGTIKAVHAEVSQLFEELQALKVVKEVPKGAELLESNMFVVEKFTASGEHDKWKARIVADGRSQDRALYPDKSSPTLAIHSLFTVFAFYAGLTGYLMSKVDIKGAFVQTPMTGPPIYMRMRSKLAKQVVDLYPHYVPFLQDDGSLLMQILKAMYGCVQASRLWFNLLTKLLLSKGYVASETDPCVMRRSSGGLIFCILIYVDDLLIFASQAETNAIRDFLTKAFKTITMSVSNSLSYLGMQIVWKDGCVTVDMDFYVTQLLTDWLHLPTKPTPGSRDTFQVDETSMPLSEQLRQVFHSTVARILYLSKRVRPDTLPVISFLCTRVTKATKQDQQKLERLLGFLRNTKTRKLYLRGMSSQQLMAFIDAAFALHFDSKSHTGVLFVIGGVVVYVSSRKQKCIAKSPTEAELVGLTDNLGLVELFHEFVSFLFGKLIPVPIVYQDCSSVISLVTRGGGITRTKHMRARVNLGKECFDEKRAIVIYCNTKQMKADGASKVLEGKGFMDFATFVQGIRTP